MTKSILGGVLSVVIGVGAIALIPDGEVGLSDGESRDGFTEHVVGKVVTRECDVIPISYSDNLGRRIRLVGGNRSEVVEDSSLGRTVVVADISEDAICPVVFEAKLKDGIPDVAIEFPMNPVSLPYSEKNGKRVFFAFTRGEECKKILEKDFYWGSTIQELLLRPFDDRRRALVTYGKCVDLETKQEYSCVIPYGDDRVIPGADVFFPSALAGRKDINFTKVKNGNPTPRYDPGGVHE